MAWYRAGGSGIPASVKTNMNNVLNKKMGTSSQVYPPTEWADDVNLMGMLEEKTVSGAIASFSDGADDVPIKSATFGIVASGGNGTPSAPVPIVGKSSVTVYQTGKNLTDLSTYVDGYVNTNGTFNTNHSNGEMRSGFIPVKPSTTYYFSIVETTGTAADWVGIGEYTSNETSSFIRRDSFWRFTTSANTHYIVISSRNLSQATKIQLEFGNDPTTYEAFKSKTPITISLGRTIYGGSVDVVQGTGTDGYSGLVALNSKQWNKTTVSGHTAFYCSLSDGYMVTGADNFDGACSSYDVTTDTTLANDKVIRFYYNSSYNISRAIIRDDQYENLTGAEFQAVVTGNMVYMLNEASETPFTFTPTPINSMLGDNNIWCDTGDSEIVYRSSGTETIITPTLISKTITENGTYSAEDDNADGYDEVTVDVPTFLVNDTDLKTSGQMLYSKSVTIAEAGDYKVIWQSYSGAPTIQVNGVTQSMTYSNSSQYAYYYCATHTLAVGDTVSFYLNDTGNNCFVAQIMKVTQNQNRGVPIEEQEENNEEEEER